MRLARKEFNYQRVNYYIGDSVDTAPTPDSERVFEEVANFVEDIDLVSISEISTSWNRITNPATIIVWYWED